LQITSWRDLEMEKYLTTMIEEKGKDIEDYIECLEDKGHFGITYQMLIDFIVSMPKEIKRQIKKTLIYIDFKNGDVFHYFDYIADGMVNGMF
jgi:hypothetical protein